MIRNLKALGLALVAMLAMSAMAAQAAQAEEPGEITTAPGAVLHGTGNLTDTLHAFGGSSTCHLQAHYKSTEIAATATEVTPEYTQTHAAPCTSSGLRATVTHNGCTFRFYNATTTGVGEDTFGVTTDINCDTGKQIEVHVYASTNSHVAGTALCTITVGPQDALEGLHLTSMTTKTPKDLTLSGTLTGITSVIHRNSFLCPTGEANDPVTGANTATHNATFVISSPITITSTVAGKGTDVVIDSK